MTTWINCSTPECHRNACYPTLNPRQCLLCFESYRCVDCTSSTRTPTSCASCEWAMKHGNCDCTKKAQLPIRKPRLCIPCFQREAVPLLEHKYLSRCVHCLRWTTSGRFLCYDKLKLFSCFACAKEIVTKKLSPFLVSDIVTLVNNYLFSPLSIGTVVKLHDMVHNDLFYKIKSVNEQKGIYGGRSHSSQQNDILFDFVMVDQEFFFGTSRKDDLLSPIFILKDS